MFANHNSTHKDASIQMNIIIVSYWVMRRFSTTGGHRSFIRIIVSRSHTFKVLTTSGYKSFKRPRVSRSDTFYPGDWSDFTLCVLQFRAFYAETSYLKMNKWFFPTFPTPKFSISDAGYLGVKLIFFCPHFVSEAQLVY